MAKVFINPGHSITTDSGAVNPRLNLKECQVVKEICTHMQKQLQSLGVETVLYQQVKSLNEVPKEANASGADIFISVHMNAPATTSGGVEVLYCENSAKGREYAQVILKNIIKVGDYNFRNRGLKDDANRHLCVLRKTKMLACLVEMGFITYDKEAKFVNENTSLCAQAIVNGIVEYLTKIGKFNQKPVENKPIETKPTETKPIEQSKPIENKPKTDIKIVPSGKGATFNLFINDTLKLKENRLETIHNYLLMNYKEVLYS